MWLCLKNRLKMKRLKRHLKSVEEAGGIGYNFLHTFGIFEGPFLHYLSEEVDINDIDAFVDCAIQLVREQRMRKVLENKRLEIIHEKLSEFVLSDSCLSRMENENAST